MAGAMKTTAVPSAPSMVEELQGLYGPYGFPEKLLQRIWRDQEFVTAGATTQAGERLAVVHPGRWNHLGGPDFKDARLRLDGREVSGDVEVHLRAGDWLAHGHASDPAYDHVVLHVVLFPPAVAWSEGGGGRRIPVLVLLPRLWHDLEEYAAEAAVAALADRPAVEPWADLREVAPVELDELIAAEGHRRWEGKVRHARRRMTQLGWANACHHAALEILGYRFNRAPMLRLAGAWPLERWRGGAATLVADAMEAGAPWHRQGVRPANRPERRIAQYSAWQQARPDWVVLLETLVTECVATGPDLARGIGAARRQVGWARRRRAWRDRLTGEAVGGVRFDHLLHDGFLPLLAAAEKVEGATARAWWWMGHPGDLPDFLLKGLRVLGLGGGPGRPLATGPAQGLLGWCLRREEASAPGGKLDNKTD